MTSIPHPQGFCTIVLYLFCCSPLCFKVTYPYLSVDPPLVMFLSVLSHPLNLVCSIQHLSALIGAVSFSSVLLTLARYLSYAFNLFLPTQVCVCICIFVCVLCTCDECVIHLIKICNHRYKILNRDWKWHHLQNIAVFRTLGYFP